jgi:hypothetical protein
MVVNSTSRQLDSGKYPVSIAKEAGWAPGPVWTGAENLASTGIPLPMILRAYIDYIFKF